MKKAIEIVADEAIITLHNAYYEHHRVESDQIVNAAIYGNIKVLSDLQRLIGSLDRETLTKIIAE